MKKLILTVIAAMLATGAYAQLRTSRTFSKVNSRTEWIIRAGVSVDKISMPSDADDYVSVGTKAAAAVDFGFNKYFGASDLYWGMELGLGSRGFSMTEEYEDEKYKADLTSYNIKYTPFEIGYKFPVTDIIKIDAHAGAFLSYDISTSTSSGVDVDKNDFDYGTQFGAGVWYNRFNLDLSYQLGFNDMFDDSEVAYGKTRNFVIRIGYRF